MLTPILSKEKCAQCKFCCTFRRESIWETPKIPNEVVAMYPEQAQWLRDRGGYAQMCLEGKYRTEDPEEEVPCLFLHPQTGCTFPEKYKPFECKIWPFRVMEKNGVMVLALASGCPIVSRLEDEVLKKFLTPEFLQIIKTEVSRKPFIAEEYRDSYRVVALLRA